MKQEIPGSSVGECRERNVLKAKIMSFESSFYQALQAKWVMGYELRLSLV